jgi:hypothetical protein
VRSQEARKPRMSRQITAITSAAFLVASLFASPSAWAIESATAEVSSADPLKKVPVCATLADFDGKIQLLDSSRSFVIDTEPNAAVPCGGWISVQTGWALVKHRDGYRLQIGAGTFLQFARPEDEDPLVLYRGQFHLESGQGSDEVVVLTANARIRQKSGRSIMIYSELSEESQLISIDKVASLESRFEPETAVPVRPGHVSSLNQKALRLVPTAPAILPIAQLQTKVKELSLPLKMQRDSVRLAKLGQERRIQDARQSRKPAGLVFEPGSYVRHKERPEDAALKQKLEERVVGGAEGRKALMRPSRSAAGVRSAKVSVVDPLAGLERRRKAEEDQEKARLMDALSRIRQD